MAHGRARFLTRSMSPSLAPAPVLHNQCAMMDAGALSTAFLSLVQTARYLGISPATLVKAGKSHPLYEPICRAIPSTGINVVRFHLRQVELIEAVMAGMDYGRAWAEWRLMMERFKSGISQEA